MKKFFYSIFLSILYVQVSFSMHYRAQSPSWWGMPRGMKASPVSRSFQSPRIRTSSGLASRTGQTISPPPRISRQQEISRSRSIQRPHGIERRSLRDFEPQIERPSIRRGATESFDRPERSFDIGRRSFKRPERIQKPQRRFEIDEAGMRMRRISPDETQRIQRPMKPLREQEQIQAPERIRGAISDETRESLQRLRDSRMQRIKEPKRAAPKISPKQLPKQQVPKMKDVVRPKIKDAPKFPKISPKTKDIAPKIKEPKKPILPKVKEAPKAPKIKPKEDLAPKVKQPKIKQPKTKDVGPKQPKIKQPKAKAPKAKAPKAPKGIKLPKQPQDLGKIADKWIQKNPQLGHKINQIKSGWKKNPQQQKMWKKNWKKFGWYHPYKRFNFNRFLNYVFFAPWFLFPFTYYPNFYIDYPTYWIDYGWFRYPSYWEYGYANEINLVSYVHSQNFDEAIDKLEKRMDTVEYDVVDAASRGEHLIEDIATNLKYQISETIWLLNDLKKIIIEESQLPRSEIQRLTDQIEGIKNRGHDLFDTYFAEGA